MTYMVMNYDISFIASVVVLREEDLGLFLDINVV